MKGYARWKEGDALPPGRLFVVREEREYRKLHVGDVVEAGQLLGIVDENIALHDLADKVAKLEEAEQEYLESGKTKGEAERRAGESERLFKLNTGVISQDAYYADKLNAERYAFEEKARDAARKVASEEVSASLSLLKLHEIRSLDRGVVKEILKRRGEAVHGLEAIVRLEVEDAASAPADRPAGALRRPRRLHRPRPRPARRRAARPWYGDQGGGKSRRRIGSSSSRVTAQDKRYKQLQEGDVVEEGQLLARLDDRLARLDVETQKNKIDGAEAALNAAIKVRKGTDDREQSLLRSPGRGVAGRPPRGPAGRCTRRGRRTSQSGGAAGSQDANEGGRGRAGDV